MKSLKLGSESGIDTPVAPILGVRSQVNMGKVRRKKIEDQIPPLTKTTR